MFSIGMFAHLVLHILARAQDRRVDLYLSLCVCSFCGCMAYARTLSLSMFISNLMFVLTFLKSVVLSRRDSTILILTAGQTKWPIIHSQN